jgi:hypothetical protein
VEADEEVALNPNDPEPDPLRRDVSCLSDFQSIEEPEELLNVRDSQSRTNPVGYAHQRQAVFVSLVPDIDPDQRTDSCRVHIGHVGKIEDQVVRLICQHFGLEFSQCG